MNNPLNKSWLIRLNQALARPKNQKELLSLLEEAAQEKLLEHSAFKMIEGVLNVYERQVRDVMVPRSQMIVLEAESTLEEILPILISSGHSRFPVTRANRDEVIGLLLAKDLLCYILDKNQPFNILDLMRPVAFIPESKRLNLLLDEFRLKHNHLAIVVDEYGNVAGMLTIEDVLEEIVGEIEDEYDTFEEEKNNIITLAGNIYRIKALTTIGEFNAFFHAHLSEEYFDTIGGLVASNFGHLPKKDESITISGFEFKILHADKRKIRLLEVVPPNSIKGIHH